MNAYLVFHKFSLFPLLLMFTITLCFLFNCNNIIWSLFIYWSIFISVYIICFPIRVFLMWYIVVVSIHLFFNQTIFFQLAVCSRSWWKRQNKYIEINWQPIQFKWTFILTRPTWSNIIRHYVPLVYKAVTYTGSIINLKRFTSSSVFPDYLKGGILLNTLSYCSTRRLLFHLTSANQICSAVEQLLYIPLQ